MEVDEQGIESKSVLTRFQTDLPPFLKKTYELVANAENNVIISWGAEGESFVVWDSGKFAREELPKHFKHNNFSSFVRQLNTYGFHKCADRWEFRHKHFRRGALDELSRITRRGGSGKASSSSHSMSLPSTPTSPSRHRASMHKGLLFQGASQAAACSGRTGLDRLGFVAGTMLQADRCSEAHVRSMAYDDLASPGEAQLANSPPHGGCVPEAEWRESEGELREELGRQGEVIRQLMAEVGRLKEQQGIMAMQLLRMDDIQQASKKQRTYHSPPPARRDPEYHEAGGGADPATNQRLGACESGLAKTAENVMTLTSNQEVLYNGMKVMEAHLKAESDSISSRVCNALSHIAAPGTELESALKHFLGGRPGSPRSKKLSDNNPAAKSSPTPPVRQSAGAVQLWNPVDFGRGRQPCREESSVASPTTARMPQS